MILSRANIWGIITGIVYAICLRLFMAASNLFQVMAVIFVFFVPFALGVIAVRVRLKSSWMFAILGPWVSVTIFMSFTFILGRKGLSWIAIALPVFLVMSSIGGLLTKLFEYTIICLDLMRLDKKY